MSFAELGIEIAFKGEGVDEIGYVVAKNNSEFNVEIGKEVVAFDPQYFRPTEVELLIGDPTKAKTKLGWKLKYELKDLVKEMVASDLALAKKNAYLKDGGHKVLSQYE